MTNLSFEENQIQYVSSFEEFISTPFTGKINAICWSRNLVGDFLEIINKVTTTDNISIINEKELLSLTLSKQGNLAREIILNDLALLETLGASPNLNIIEYYERHENNPYFPTDVYSFHVDRSPIPVDTFLCTYYGASSEILPNSQGVQKILVPKIRAALKKEYMGTNEGFEAFLSEHFLDLHYEAKPNAQPFSLGIGNIWRLATDYPHSKVLPCIHRAPLEKNGEKRLLLIC